MWLILAPQDSLDWNHQRGDMDQHKIPAACNLSPPQRASLLEFDNGFIQAYYYVPFSCPIVRNKCNIQDWHNTTPLQSSTQHILQYVQHTTIMHNLNICRKKSNTLPSYEYHVFFKELHASKRTCDLLASDSLLPFSRVLPLCVPDIYCQWSFHLCNRIKGANKLKSSNFPQRKTFQGV